MLRRQFAASQCLPCARPQLDSLFYTKRPPSHPLNSSLAKGHTASSEAHSQSDQGSNKSPDRFAMARSPFLWGMVERVLDDVQR